MNELPICGWCHQPYGTDFNAHRRNECPDMRDLSQIRPALLERVRAEARAAALAETPETISAPRPAFYCERHQRWEPVGARYCQNPSVV